MDLKYFIGSEEHKISICKEIDNSVVNQIEKLKSDKNVLIIVDDNINNQLINKLKTVLKIRGYNLYFFLCKRIKKK